MAFLRQLLLLQCSSGCEQLWPTSSPGPENRQGEGPGDGLRERAAFTH